MEILTFVFLILNLLVMLVNAWLLYEINFKQIKARDLIYSDYVGQFWEKGDIYEDDICS